MDSVFFQSSSGIWVQGKLRDFQTLVGAAVHGTLDIEQLISHTRTAFVGTVASLKHSDGGIILVSEVHE